MAILKSKFLPSILSKLCVVSTLFLIFLGAIVTTYDAGMAAPNAPHVDGSYLNPLTPGTDLPWYKNPPLFKEHSHRLAAICVGISMGMLAAILWNNWTAFFVAVAFMGVASVGKKFGLSPEAVAHLRIWPAMGIFIGLLLAGAKRRRQVISTDQKLVLIAYIATCIQAALGSLRVEIETASDLAYAANNVALGAQKLALATNIRTFHGVFAQIFLALVVVISARLSPVWDDLGQNPRLEAGMKVFKMAVALLLIYILQLACAAYLRHRGLGLAIPTWPNAGNGLMPPEWTHAVGIHFLHTRILPILITGHVIGSAAICIKRASVEGRLVRISWAIVGLTFLQFVLGVMVIWKGRHPHITNTHVMVGAFICALTALLAARAWRVSCPR
jgi:heme A synthase